MIKTKWRLVLAFGLSLSLGGCAMFDTVMPPPQTKVKSKPETEDTRSEAQLNKKLSTFRTKKTGESIYAQKKEARSELDAVIGDTEKYIKDIEKFSQKHPAKKKYRKKIKKDKKIPQKEVENEKSDLRFY